MINLLIHSILKIDQIQLAFKSADCSDKKLAFLDSYFGNLTNSVDPDQPASEEAGWSGYALFFKQFMLCCLWKLIDVRVTLFHLLKIASDGDFNLLFSI